MTAAIILLLFGLYGLVGCICGATHHAMTSAVCIILGLRLLQDYYEAKRRTHKG